MDTYQLKSLDGVLEGSLDAMRFHRDKMDGSISLSLFKDSTADNFALRDKYDTVLRCLGFKFDMDIFNEWVKTFNRYSLNKTILVQVSLD